MMVPKVQHKNQRPTIGVVLANLSGTDFTRWLGIADMAKEADVNLICFTGEALQSPFGSEAQANKLYELINPAFLDGLIIFSSRLNLFVDEQAWADFCQRFQPLPIFSIDGESSIASEAYSTYEAVCTAVSHLIEAHHCQRIAFVRGPASHVGAEERYQAYRDTLFNRGLSIDPDLILSPTAEGWAISRDWHECPAITQFLDRCLEKDNKPDAIVTANDSQATLVLAELQKRGIRVPNDIAVIGHDDVSHSRTTIPPLTTIRVPFYQSGREILSTMLAYLRGEPISPQIKLSGTLVIRRSCGCQSRRVTVANTPFQQITPQSISFKQWLAPQRQALIADLIQTIHVRKPDVAERWASELLNAFSDALDQSADTIFINQVEATLNEVLINGDDVTRWQNVLSAMRRNLIAGAFDPQEKHGIENLFNQARVVSAFSGESLGELPFHSAAVKEPPACFSILWRIFG